MIGKTFLIHIIALLFSVVSGSVIYVSPSDPFQQIIQSAPADSTVHLSAGYYVFIDQVNPTAVLEGDGPGVTFVTTANSQTYSIIGTGRNSNTLIANLTLHGHTRAYWNLYPSEITFKNCVIQNMVATSHDSLIIISGSDAITNLHDTVVNGHQTYVTRMDIRRGNFRNVIFNDCDLDCYIECSVSDSIITGYSLIYGAQMNFTNTLFKKTKPQPVSYFSVYVNLYVGGYFKNVTFNTANHPHFALGVFGQYSRASVVIEDSSFTGNFDGLFASGNADVTIRSTYFGFTSRGRVMSTSGSTVRIYDSVADSLRGGSEQFYFGYNSNGIT